MTCFDLKAAMDINFTRIKHLESLKLDLKDKYILETGCGAKGDITQYLLKQSKHITLNDAREINIKSNLKNNHVSLNYNIWDLNEDLPTDIIFDIVISYGTLYHLHNPSNTIKNLANISKELLVLSTIVTGTKDNNSVNIIEEPNNIDQSYTNKGCRPGREWVTNEFKKHFKYVYFPITQPDNIEFPKLWPTTKRARFIIIGSHNQLDNIQLTDILPYIYK